MSLEQPVIAIIGAGAVGGYYGARLAQHGYPVHFLLRSDYEQVRERGWEIKSCDGDFGLVAGATGIHRSPGAMPKADLVIVTLKCTANDQYAELITPLIKEDTLILTLQNGLGNEEELARLFGRERILGGLAFVCINRVGPGVIHHLDHGYIRMGEFVEDRRDRAERISAIFNQCKIPCDVLPSLKYGRWEKLAWNVPFNGLGAALDLSTDQVIGSEQGIELVTEIIREVMAAAATVGVKLPEDMPQIKVRQTRTMGAYKSSMQIDRQLRRPMEVEAILGEPWRVSQAAGLTNVRMGMLYRMVQLVNLGTLSNRM